ncbi:hypothetical protein [Methanofollis liminatans]|uniref:hypothetical protein n=1 Tax=Methanofollis liminatans TaxID=2201 RepID=UPI0012F62727|nr:hypothetical protein [Methanofollis liminatans]
MKVMCGGVLQVFRERLWQGGAATDKDVKEDIKKITNSVKDYAPIYKYGDQGHQEVDA